jgi:hypothetical protein
MRMEFNNGNVLAALHLVLYRQIPWHKRPAILTSLVLQGLIQSIDHKPPASATYLPPLKIAILTDKGRQEIARIDASKHLAGWLGNDYFVTFMEEAAFT